MKPQPVLICTLHATDLSFAFFTHAHMRIFQLMLKGKEVIEIADTLGLTERTIQNEIEDMAHCLQCNNKFAFFIRCFNCGFIEMKYQAQPPRVVAENKPLSFSFNGSTINWSVNTINTDVKFIYTLTKTNIHPS